jgi:hypothetical protein
VPDEQLSQQPWAERRKIRPPGTCNDKVLRLGLIERGQMGIIAKRRHYEDEDDMLEADMEFPADPRLAPPAGGGLVVPERFVRRGYGASTGAGARYIDMQEYEVYEPVGFNANMALEEVIIYNAKRAGGGANWATEYVDDMLTYRTPAAVWHDRFFLGGPCYEQVPSTKPGTSLHHTTGGWHMPKPAWAPSALQSGQPDSLRRLAGQANTTFITGGLFENMLDYSAGEGTTLMARSAFVFKRFPITSKKIYKILSGAADYDYEGSATGPYAAGLTGDFSLPDLAEDEVLYALQLAHVSWSFGTRIPMDYLTYKIEEPVAAYKARVPAPPPLVAGAPAPPPRPPKRKYECFDGITLELGFVFARPNQTRANERIGCGKPTVSPADLQPCSDNQALRSSLATPPINFFVNFDREHN